MQNKISSSATFVSKKVFPVVWFGFLAVFLFKAIADGGFEKDVMFLFVPLFMAVFGFVLMKKLAWDLMDFVYDCGSYLLVRNGSVEDKVYLSDIMNVSASTNMNPPRITLRLRKVGKFGDEVSFSPVSPFTLNPFAKNKVAEDLINRVDSARNRTVV